MRRKIKKSFSFRLCLVWIVFGTMQLCSNIAITSAHSPHDVIDAIGLSPIFEKDNTLFIIISDHLRKSTNGGVGWKELVNGLDHKNLLSSISISYAFETDQTLLVSSDGDGIYRSKNGGASWVGVNAGLNDLHIGLLAMSPMAGNQIILAAGSRKGLYKSENGGDNWHKIIDDLRVTAISYLPASGGKKILIGGSLGVLYISQDAGETWNLFAQNPEWGAINLISLLPAVNARQPIIIGTEKKGLIKTTDEGLSFTSISKGLPESANMRSLAISPAYAADATLFATTWHEAIFRSVDGGESWEKHAKGITKDSQADSPQYRSPHFRDIRISNSADQNKIMFLGGFDGLFKSLNSGNDWFQLETLPVSQIKGLAVSTGTDNYSIAITTYGGGAYISKDKGESWLIANKGLKTTRLSDIAFSPNYPEDNTIYSASIGFLLKSTDAGQHWQKISLSPAKWRHWIWAILNKLKVPHSLSNKILEKSERQKKWPTIICLSPIYSNNRELFFATRYHGIFRSFDGGIKISRMWDGMQRPITALIVSPGLQEDGTLFASVRGMGVFKTRDKGKNWQPVNDGLPFVDEWEKLETIHQIAIKDVKLAISPSYSADQTVFVGSSEGLFKTSDGGDRWQNLRMSASGRSEYVIGLALSPGFSEDGTLVVSLRGKGLFRSTDGGRTFKTIGNDLRQNNHSIEYIDFSPQYAVDHTIFAASDEELFKSTDEGNSWQVIKRPVRYENHREVFQYEGQWDIVKGDQYSASSISVCSETSAKANVYFVGTGVALIGPQDQNLGIAKIFIDDKFIAAVDQYSSDTASISELYYVRGLALSPHKLTIEVTGNKNPSSKGNRVSIDAVDVFHQGL